MSSGSGLNTEEVQQALADLKAQGGQEEQVRYLERVLESRGVRKADVSSHEIVLGNPDAYPETTVAEQEDLAIGRPHEPIAPADLGVRGSVDLNAEPFVVGPDSDKAAEAPVDDSARAAKKAAAAKTAEAKK